MRKLIRNISILVVLNYSCTTDPVPSYDIIEKALHREYASNTAGIALAVVDESGEIWSGSFGMADIKNAEAMTNDHVLNIASVSKLIVATAMMRLVEKGEVDLDQSVGKYLAFDLSNPYFPDKPITIRQLLTHRSSILDNKFYEESYTTGPEIMDLQTWLEGYFVKGGPHYSNDNFGEYAPGTDWRYSNVGYGLLGLVIENVAGVSLEAFCRNEIFLPLKMDQSQWVNPKAGMSVATSYLFMEELPDERMKTMLDAISTEEIVKDRYIPLERYRFPNYPDGLLFTSVNDLKIFAQMVLNGGELNGQRILKKSTLNQMLQLQGPADDKQGIGWRYTGMGTIWGHGGDDPGVQTGLYLDVEKKLGMVMIKNSNVGSRTSLLKQLYRAADK